MKKKVSIVGPTGYTGLELVKFLLRHQHVEIKHLAVRRDPLPIYSEIFPELRGVCDIKCCDINANLICKDSDIIFFALPHKVSMTIIPDFIDKGCKLIDLSADYRLKDLNIYSNAYKESHKDENNLNKFVYGLSETNTKLIEKAQYIANPGCFPTSIICALAPLFSSDLICNNNIIIDSKTGVSGGGRTPNIAFHFPECNESVKAYKVGVHQHEPEIEQELSLIANKKVDVIFVPHLIPMTRGMLTTIYADLKEKCSYDKIYNLYKEKYKNKFFMRIMNQEETPETKNVMNTNFCDIAFKIIGDKIIVISAIDNLVKGASGQAIQNMNIMLGFNEKEGLI